MKAYTDKLKRIVATTALALIATTSPMWAQDAQNPGAQPSAQDQSTIQVNEPRVQTSDSSSMQSPQLSESDNQMSQSSGAIMDEPAGADNSENNWSWIGLLGLLGLFGLKRRHDVHDEHYRTARA